MYRMIANHKRTASVHKSVATLMCDDGWEEIIDCTMNFNSDEEAIAWLLNNGWEEYDPNSSLKAQGYIFINGCYRMP